MKKKSLGKMMTEFSHELGINQTKKNHTGRKILMYAGGIIGMGMLRNMLRKMK